MEDISHIPDKKRSIYDLVLQDISKGKSNSGAHGSLDKKQLVYHAAAEQVISFSKATELLNKSVPEFNHILEVTFI